MNHFISKYLFYFPVTLLNRELLCKYFDEYKKYQFLSKQEATEIQTQRLNSILNYAKKHSVYYGRLLGNNYSTTEFQRIQFLTKQVLIDDFDILCTSRAKGATLKTTGGSTGEPVKLFKNPDALARERVATWRSYGWAGVDIGDKQARFWGVPHTANDAFKAKIIDFVSNRKRISAFNLTYDSLNLYYKILHQFKPKYLYGYVSVIKRFCEHISENKLPLVESIKAIITTSEVLTDADRSLIESTTQVKVFNEYGCGEVGSIAHECEHGKMHIVSDNLYVELVDSQGNQADTGEVVVTDYFNLATPMIRYKVGDFASFSKEECPCGRTLPILKGIHGRAYDMIVLKNGKCIHPEAIIYIFEDLQKQQKVFQQFQVIQRTIECIDINYIPTKEFSAAILGQIKMRISEKVDPDITVTFNKVSQIAREASGKMRVVKSNVKISTCSNNEKRL